MEITAGMVKELRDRTSVGILDCKKALRESNGDIDAAVIKLREQGLAAASKKASRDMNEGRVVVADKDGSAVVFILHCETDFVAGNQDFIDFGNQLAECIVSNEVADADALQDKEIDGVAVSQRISDAVLKLGENISVGDITLIKGETLATYLHSNGKIGTAVAFSGSVDADLAKDIAMHIAAANPSFLSQDQVPEAVLEQERDIIRKQMENDNKPANVIENIVNGKIAKYYKENCLVEQAFVKDPDQSIQGVVGSATVSNFARLSLVD